MKSAKGEVLCAAEQIFIQGYVESRYSLQIPDTLKSLTPTCTSLSKQTEKQDSSGKMERRVNLTTQKRWGEWEKETDRQWDWRRETQTVRGIASSASRKRIKVVLDGFQR